MKKIGVCAGSFDPCTNGHIWLIQKAAALMDELHIAVGNNPGKKHSFDANERLSLLNAVLADSLPPEDLACCKTFVLSGELLINAACDLGATHLVRGIRDVKDFEYERQMAQVNSKIAPKIETVFLITPPHLSEVSSSTVKGLVGFRGWENAVAGYVHPAVMRAMKDKFSQNGYI